MINTDLIGFFLIYYFALQVLWKDNGLPNFFERFGSWLNSDLIKEAGECVFCMSFWVAVVMTITVMVATNEPMYILWAFYVTAINAQLKK